MLFVDLKLLKVLFLLYDHALDPWPVHHGRIGICLDVEFLFSMSFRPSLTVELYLHVPAFPWFNGFFGPFRHGAAAAGFRTLYQQVFFPCVGEFE